LPPNYVGPVYHQPGSPVVTAPSAATAAAGTETTDPPSTLGVTNAQSTLMTTYPSTTDEQIKLTTDLLASAMSRSVPPNWWGYGMPPEMMLKTPGTSQTADTRGNAPMASAPPNFIQKNKSQAQEEIINTSARSFIQSRRSPKFHLELVFRVRSHGEQIDL